MADCAVCGSPLDEPFVQRHHVPVHQNRPLDSAAGARAVLRGELAVAYCPRCNFGSNVEFDPSLISYRDGYANSQVWSPMFDHYVDSIVEELARLGVRKKRILEIGSGDGYFLSRLCTRTESTGVGFDPAYHVRQDEAHGPVRFVQDIYTPGHEDAGADVIICRHVIEHLQDPLGLLKSVRAGMGENPNSLVFFETPDLAWILNGLVFHDFFYEHCSYFTDSSLRRLLQIAGFQNIVVQTAFGGQYLWATAQPVSSRPSLTPQSQSLRAAIRRYTQSEALLLARAAEQLTRIGSPGLALWGAGAKGVTFLNLLDPGAEFVDVVVDLNPAKQGRYVPGTGHSIMGPAEALRGAVRQVLVTNPNYLSEVRAAAAGVPVNLAIPELN